MTTPRHLAAEEGFALTTADGGQAFPHGDPTNGGALGMTLREWFAGQALAGLARDIGEDVTVTRRQSIVSVAFEFADAMLAERAK